MLACLAGLGQDIACRLTISYFLSWSTVFACLLVVFWAKEEGLHGVHPVNTTPQEENRLPKLELWKPSDEGPELVLSFRWQCWALHLWIDLRGQKSQQQVQVVDSEGVGDDIEALDVKDPETIYQNKAGQGQPSPVNVRCCPVEKVPISSADCLQGRAAGTVHVCEIFCPIRFLHLRAAKRLVQATPCSGAV